VVATPDDAGSGCGSEVAMSEPSDSRREPDDAMARQSGAVSEDVQPVATAEDSDDTAQGSTQSGVESARLVGTDNPETRQ
jgi:hypothetical protein